MTAKNLRKATDSDFIPRTVNPGKMRESAPVFFKLKRRQQQVLLEYMKTGSWSQAMRNCGYHCKDTYTACKMAWKFRRSLNVAEALAEIQEWTIEEAGISATQILLDVADTVRRCREGTPVLDRDGNPTGVWQFDAAGALRGLELLGRYRRLWSDRDSADGRSTPPPVFNLIFPDGMPGQPAPVGVTYEADVSDEEVTEPPVVGG